MNQNRKGGSRKCSLVDPNSKEHSTSKKVESVSRYFIKQIEQREISPKEEKQTIENMKHEETNLDLDSPYKNLIKTDTKLELNDSTGDAADFRSPFLIRKPTSSKLDKKPAQKSQSKSKISGKRSNKKTANKKMVSRNFATKTITDHFKYFGENEEHMQMAIALSKSTYEAECGNSCPSPPEEEKLNISDLVKNSKPSLLEKFGFTSDKLALPIENRRVISMSEGGKKAKNRFKYISSILNIRTEEARKSLIDSKISRLLCQKNPDIETCYEQAVHSNTLNNYISKERSIFNLDDIYEKDYFYVKCINIPQNTCKCRYLFKDWNSIPGRDKSPCKKVENVPYKRVTETSMNKITIINCNDVHINYEKHAINNMSSIKQLHGTSLSEVSCSFTIPNKMQKTYFGSFNSESKDSRMVTSFASSTKSTVLSSDSPKRSLSPDLFDSDDEMDQVLNISENNELENLSSPKKNIILEMDNSLNKNLGLKDDQMKFKNDNFIKNSDSFENPIGNLECSSKIDETTEVIDLTDEVDSDCEYNSKKNDYSISLQTPKLTDKSSVKQKLNIYSLDEFEEDDNLKIDLKCNKTHLKENKEYTNDLKNQTRCGLYNRKYNSSDYIGTQDEEKIIATIENDSVTKQTNIIDLTIDNTIRNNICFFNDIDYKNDDGTDDIQQNEENISSNSPGKHGIQNSSVSKFNNMSSNHSLQDYHSDDLYSSPYPNDTKENNKEQSGNNSNDTPQGSQTYERSCYNKMSHNTNEACYTKEVNNKENISLSTDDNNSSLEATPKKWLENNFVQSPCFDEPIFVDSNNVYGTTETSNQKITLDKRNNSSIDETPTKWEDIKSPCFDEPNFHDSANLNVTDYVNNMLNQDNFSFNKVDHGSNDSCVQDQDQDKAEEILSQNSQNSVIVDEELNYSSHFSTSFRGVYDKTKNKTTYSYDVGSEDVDDIVPLSPDSNEDASSNTPQPQTALVNSNELVPITTMVKQIPTFDAYIIKTNNVSPMPEYDHMTTPLINRELQKVGVKPLKRTRGVKLLKYIYESTHPFVASKEKVLPDNTESDEDEKFIKRRKKSNRQQSSSEYNSSSLTNSSSSFNHISKLSVDIIGNRIIENEKPENFIFERKPSGKIPSCKVPLQIVWYNFVNSNPDIKENILLYEPLQLESLHVMLKELGFKFHIQDLLTFLDQKCITIRTAQKQGKMHK